MKQKISLTALVIIGAMSIVSCNKDSQDNADSKSSNLSLKMEALNKSHSMPVSADGLKSATANAMLVWDQATMVVSSVSFEAEMKSVLTGKDSIEIEFKWKGPRTIDLFDLSSTIGSIVIPSGVYEKISMKVKSEKEDANGLPLFFLAGNYTNTAGAVLPVEIWVTDPFSFKTVQKNDTIIAGQNGDLSGTIQLYLDQLMLKIDPTALDEATLTDGIIVVSADSNNELYDLILMNIKKDQGCKYKHDGKDDDDDDD